MPIGHRWKSAAVWCITWKGTEAERDIQLLSEARLMNRLNWRRQALGIELGKRISFVLMPRLLGHGGFASNEIYISYLDRNYAGESTSQVFHHEIIHVLDAHLRRRSAPQYAGRRAGRLSFGRAL